MTKQRGRPLARKKVMDPYVVKLDHIVKFAKESYEEESFRIKREAKKKKKRERKFVFQLDELIRQAREERNYSKTPDDSKTQLHNHVTEGKPGTTAVDTKYKKTGYTSKVKRPNRYSRETQHISRSPRSPDFESRSPTQNRQRVAFNRSGITNQGITRKKQENKIVKFDVSDLKISLAPNKEMHCKPRQKINKAIEQGKLLAGSQVIVTHSFQGVEGEDLSLFEGDIIQVENKQDSWWLGTNLSSGERGYFPSNFVEAYILQEVSPQKTIYRISSSGKRSPEAFAEFGDDFEESGDKVEREEAAIIIQSRFRNHKQNSLESPCTLMKAYKSAAKTIQKSYRRKSLGRKKKAAECIQSQYRRRRMKLKMKRESSARVIQKQIKCNSLGYQLKEYRAAALTIQCTYRRGRKKVESQKAALVIQNRYRNFKAYDNEKKSEAAKTIQRQFRQRSPAQPADTFVHEYHVAATAIQSTFRKRRLKTPVHAEEHMLGHDEVPSSNQEKVDRSMLDNVGWEIFIADFCSKCIKTALHTRSKS